MKSKKKESRKAEAAAAKAAAAKGRRGPARWPAAVAFAAALVAVWWAYTPAMHGPFLFDDNILPFALPGFSASLREWVRGLRPVTMFSYWVNSQLSGEDTFSY